MSSREETYCVKERKYTKNINPTIKTSKNGNNYIQSTCFVCGNKKSSFIKSSLQQNNQNNQNNKKKKNGSNNAKTKKNNGNGSNHNGNGKTTINKNVNIKDFFYKKNKR